MVTKGPGALLLGRSDEREVLDRLLDCVRAGGTGVLVVRGEPGVGKTALLKYAISSASGFRVVRAVGIESEMELPFAALQQVCAPMLNGLVELPGPQQEALRVAFGLSSGPAPDRFLVGLAVLSLLSAAAEEQPLLCVVDDAQWLDRASTHALAFVARRALAESLAFLFASRKPAGSFTGLAELVVEGLPEGDARALLDSVINWPLDERVRDRIVAETRGNPLALLELPRGLTAAELAGGFGLPQAHALPSRIEDSFRRRIEGLPLETQRLLQVAAADPVGDPILMWRAADGLGIGASAADAAQAEGLLEVGAVVTFRHPLVRSAVYRAAMPDERRAVHGALAEATDFEVDPDRRVWHLAQAAVGFDEDIASELERSAGRAQARGGLAAAAAFVEKAAAMTPDPKCRAERALAAAQAKLRAGALEPALALAATAESGPLGELGRAQLDVLRAQILVRVEPRDRRPAAAPQGRQAARAAGSAPRPRNPFERPLLRDVRRPSGQRGRLCGGGERRACRAPLITSLSSGRPAPRRARTGRHRWARCRCRGDAACAERLPRGRALPGRMPCLGRDRLHCLRPHVGLRELGRNLCPPRSVRP
jgi:hypothetical protein